MERQYIVGISILTLLAVMMSIPLFTFNTNKTGMAVEVQSAVNCTDSDGGIDYYQKGITQGLPIGVDDPAAFMSRIDYCLENGFTLIEYFCNDTIHGNGISYNCPNGCSNGTCTNQTQNCTDSDMGLNYYVKGTLNYNGTYYTDSCLINTNPSDPTSLTSVYECNGGLCFITDYICEGATFKRYNNFSCPNGCRNGACKSYNLTKFSEELTTDLTNLNLSNVTNFSIGIINKGRVQFTVPLDLRSLDIDNNIIIQPNLVQINTSQLPQLNKSAIITLYNVTLKNPAILKDGVVCAKCNITSYKKNTLVFSVPSWSEYSLIETMVCGNGVIEQNITYQINNSNGTSENRTYNEDCEGLNLNNKICINFGYHGGNLTCSSSCSFNFSSCYNISCNNNTICEPPEDKTNCASDCECSPGESRPCGFNNIGICKYGAQICNSTGRWNICVAAALPMNETCNNLDDNCNGQVDEGFDWNNDSIINKDERFDYDNDDYFPITTLFHNLTCTNYTEYDCNDNSSIIHPGTQCQQEGYLLAKWVWNQTNSTCFCIGKPVNVTNYTANVSMDKIILGTLRKEGSMAYIREGDWAVFTLNSISGKIEVKNITASGAVLIVSSIQGYNLNQLPDTLINLNETKQFDLDRNGKDEISIQLQSILSGFKVGLLVKDISEFMSPPICNNNNVCESQETETNCPNDCKKVIFCNNNGICEDVETPETCPSDCKVIETPIEEKAPVAGIDTALQHLICNSNGVCEDNETPETCPSDCKPFSFKNIIILIVAIALLLTIVSGGIVVKSKSDKYHVNKELKQNIIRALDMGYNLNTLNSYLTSQKLKDIDLKKGLRYGGDFMALKQAVTFYTAQGHNEIEVRQLCEKNKWPKSITNEVFDDIHKSQKNVQNIKKPAQPAKTNVQKYQIRGF